MDESSILSLGIEPEPGGSKTEDSTWRAAIYARTSSRGQRFGYSLEEQVRLCVERCGLLDWEVAYVFQDGETSGKNTDRPMFQQMLSLARQGAFDVLVFWKLDRFSRSIMHAVTLEADFRKWGVALHSLTEQIDTTTPAGQFNFRNLANAAEFEREMIRQRAKMGQIARALEGKWPNRNPPFGYSVDKDGYLVIDKEEAALVKQIFSMYIAVRSMPAVIENLNLNSRDLARNSKWNPAKISRILRDRIYLGERMVEGEVQNQPECAIIEKEIFELAEKIRTRFQRGALREPIEPKRKKQRVNRMLNQYREWSSGQQATEGHSVGPRKADAAAD
ncbi:recombinase family protein [Haloglomus salinum]|uniref:recombinase family protein n=1 Tax=Haloglomus salinum TaxID=2962673 RepID=UPI0020C97468|nr:recombinase family protein [Haloglomus salinum]